MEGGRAALSSVVKLNGTQLFFLKLLWLIILNSQSVSNVLIREKRMVNRTNFSEEIDTVSKEGNQKL